MTDITLLNGDCLGLLPTIESDSIDLIMTSPPYANQRKKFYGGIEPDKYSEWFIPIANELFRVLKPSGTFILNIKEHAEGGARSTYVMRLVLDMIDNGWLWTEQFIWVKRGVPGKWKRRFKNEYEPLFQFNKSLDFEVYHDNVLMWSRQNNASLEADKRRKQRYIDNSVDTRASRKDGLAFESDIVNAHGVPHVLPSNVLHVSTVIKHGEVKHSAVYPEGLPEFFIRAFTMPQDTVLDPFLGSGTTGAVSKRLQRHFIGIEMMKEYYELATKRINEVKQVEMF